MVATAGVSENTTVDTTTIAEIMVSAMAVAELMTTITGVEMVVALSLYTMNILLLMGKNMG